MLFFYPLFWFQRTSFLNANRYFNKAAGIPTPFQLQNRIGFNLGGPLSFPKVYSGKEKTWFFTAFEAFREPLSRNRLRVVLSDPARTGLFTYKRSDNGQLNTVNLLTLGTVPTINSAVMNYYNGLVPSANTDAGCSSGDTLNIRCFAWNVPGKSLQNRYTARIDHQLTANHGLEFVYNQANFNSMHIHPMHRGFQVVVDPLPGSGIETRAARCKWVLAAARLSRLSSSSPY